MSENQTEKEIIFYGTRWCSDTIRSINFLDKHQIAYRWVDIDEDSDGRAFVLKVNQGMASVPTILFPDGGLLVEPNDRELSAKLKL